VRCFGAFEVHAGGEPVADWSTGKARNLFQYLLLHRGRIIRRENLAEALWPGCAWSSSGSLKAAVHAVRRTLGRRPVEIISGEHGYRLDATGLWLDIDEFDSALRQAHAAESRGARAEALACYRRATQLYTGDFLPGEDGKWGEEQREYYRTLAHRARTALRRGDHEEAPPSGPGQFRHRRCVRRPRQERDAPPAETTHRVFAKAVRGERRVPEPAVSRTGGARRSPAPRPSHPLAPRPSRPRR
jgi:DNA-binding winged helix-turn-helix (wHTH) protein